MSLQGTGVFNLFMRQKIVASFVLLAGFSVVQPAHSQYPGQIKKKSTDAPILRAVGVLEWTGQPGKPKKSRLVPITIFDGQQLQDASVYLARPEPMAVAREVEYQLEKNGKTIGLFDIDSSGQEQGSWVGFGSWKPLPVAQPKHSQTELAQTRIDDDEGSDLPILHRKAHPGEATSDSKSGSAGTSATNAPAPDPDRPTLHQKTSRDETDSTESASSASPPDPDRPILHKSKPEDDSAKSKKKRDKGVQDTGYVEFMSSVDDSGRPHLIRGQRGNDGPPVLPSLMGLPSDMQQTVAVSDARNLADHPWSYSWANPQDEVKMKADLEDIARAALGLNTPPAPVPAPTRSKSRRKTKSVPPPTPPGPAPLEDEHFRVFELAYGSGATLVLSASTGGPPAQQKFVTLIAQPDLYGNVLVLLKHITDSAHLDVSPRMRLIDAVDAMADNRGELLFELRGTTQRQFALYRVLRGQIQKLFVTGGGDFGGSGSY
jgi:hypothetical protein